MLEYHMIWLIDLWWNSIYRKAEVFWEWYHIFSTPCTFLLRNRYIKNELKYFLLYFQLGSGLFYQMLNLNYGTITMIFSCPEFLVMTRNIILYTACVKHSRWQKEYQILTWRKIKPLQLFQSRSCHHISKSAQFQNIHISIILLFSVQNTLSLMTTAYNFNLLSSPCTTSM